MPASTSPALPLTFIDLFAGIGGMRRGLESINARCVFTSEWNRFARKTYEANFPASHPLNGDITKVKTHEIPSHDLLLAGFPCQPFSLAGVSKKNALNRPHGFECETQGTLFFDVARIIDHHRPAAFLLENVKNLKSHDRGKTFEVICKTLREDLGYELHHRVIDASAFVPQHRERIFLVGFRQQTTFDISAIELPDPLIRLGAVLHPEDGTEPPEPPFTSEENGAVSEKYTLSVKLWDYLQAYAAKHRAKGNGFGYSLFGPDDRARTLSARYYKDGSEILIRQSGSKRPRRLTPRECSRLMGFDQTGRSEFIIPVSDTQAYTQFGNAVVPAVVGTLARNMEPFIRTIRNDSIQKAQQLNFLRA